MTSTALSIQETEAKAQLFEQVIVAGDLKGMSPVQRVNYYRMVCESVGLNPLTKPFEYVTLNGKLTLYARRDATDQLRRIYGVSLSKPVIEYRDDLVIATVDATDRTGRTDSDAGAVSIKNLQGESKANAILKAITKAKRRVTLSICGLGWLDETEVDSVPNVQRVRVDASTGEILDKPADVDFYPSTDNPFDGPTDEENDILATWQTPEDARVWAVNTGACANEYEAKNSFAKIVTANGGRLTKANVAGVYLQFLRRQMEKLAEAEAQPVLEPEPEVAF